MSQLFNRTAALTIIPSGQAGVRFTDLRIAFEIEKDQSSVPNRIEVTLYNLSDATVRSLKPYEAVLTLEAGYQESVELLAAGDLTEIKDTWESVDRTTRLVCGDGARATRSATLFESFASGVTARQIFDRLAAAMGVPLGEVQGIAPHAYQSGFAASGTARATLDTLARRLGVRWSIQDGQLQVLPIKAASQAEAVLLSPDSGLLETPERTEEGISLKCLLNPRLRPGGRIQVEARAVKGLFRLERVVHSGDTHGDAWHSELEAVEVNA